MKQIGYSMRFTGQAGPVEGSEGVLKAATSAPSCIITSSVGPDGLSGSIDPASGEATTFESEVTFTGAMTFLESGSTTFGENGNSLRFSTVGEGHLKESAVSKLMHGTVMWQIDDGEGHFTGASGLITSNFMVDEAGAVTDHHSG